MLEKALAVLEGKIKSPAELYEAVTHKKYGLGDLTSHNKGHPLAHRALKLDHVKKTAEIDDAGIEHLKILSDAFLNEAKHDDILIKKSNHSYALCYALVVMHHHRLVLDHSDTNLEEIKAKLDALAEQVKRLHALQNNIAKNDDDSTYLSFKTALTRKRTELIELKQTLNTRYKRIIEIKEEETRLLLTRDYAGAQTAIDEGDVSPSTSSSNESTGVVYINIGGTPQSITYEHPAPSSPATIELSATRPQSPMRERSLDSANEQLPYQVRQQSFESIGLQASDDKKEEPSLSIVSDSLAAETKPDAKELKLEVTPVQSVAAMLVNMKKEEEWDTVNAKDRQKQYFIGWVCKQDRKTLIYLSDYMQDVQNGVRKEPSFDNIRQGFFCNLFSNANSQAWVDLGHALKTQIIELERSQCVRAVVHGRLKYVVEDKRDAENRKHLSRHRGRLFTRWGSPSSMDDYEENFIAQSSITARRV